MTVDEDDEDEPRGRFLVRDNEEDDDERAGAVLDEEAGAAIEEV